MDFTIEELRYLKDVMECVLDIYDDGVVLLNQEAMEEDDEHYQDSEVNEQIAREIFLKVAGHEFNRNHD